MYRFEKFRDIILAIPDDIGVGAKDGIPCSCADIAYCSDCELIDCTGTTNCSTRMLKWLYEEYIEPEIPEHIEKDTRILVSDDGVVWNRRYFERYEEDVYGDIIGVRTFPHGATSWSCENESEYWNYVKLLEKEEVKNG